MEWGDSQKLFPPFLLSITYSGYFSAAFFHGFLTPYPEIEAIIYLFRKNKSHGETQFLSE